MLKFERKTSTFICKKQIAWLNEELSVIMQDNTRQYQR